MRVLCPALFRVVYLSALVLPYCNICVAQGLPPLAPLFPHSLQECQSFSQQVEAYAAAMVREHQQCLDAHKPDRNVPPDNPQSPDQVCSRSACQYLHDWVYGSNDLISPVRRIRGEVTKCYSDAKQYLAEQAKEEQARQQRDAESKAQREREQADERTREQQLRARREREQTDERMREQQLRASRDERSHDEQKAVPSNVYGTQPVPSTSTASPSSISQTQDLLSDPYAKQSEKQSAKEALADLADPFEKAKQERAAMNLNQPPEGLVDPFSNSHAASDKIQDVDPNEKAKERGVEIFHKEIDTLADDIGANIAAAKAQLRGKARTNYVERAKDVSNVISDVGHTITGLEYGALLKDTYEAYAGDTRARQEYTTEKLAYKVTTDVVKYQFSKSALSEGLQNVSLKLFAREVAPYVVKGVEAGAAAVSIVFDSERTGDYHEIVRDTTGQYSLQDKQHALYVLWKAYDNHGSSWGPNEMRGLIDETDIVYKEAHEAAQQQSSGSGRVQ